MNRLFLALLAVATFGASLPARAETDTVDPMAVAAARELLDAMRYKFTLAADMKAASGGAEELLGQMVSRKLDAAPKLSAADRAKAVAALNQKMPNAVSALEGVFTDPQTSEDITRETARSYARLFTVEELVQITAFYRTPAGQKLLGMSARVQAESLAFGRKYIAGRVDKVVDDLMKNTTPAQPASKDAK